MKEIKFSEAYTIGEIMKMGSVPCEKCIYSGGGNICYIAADMKIKAEEFYHDSDGKIIGCIHGSDRDERIQ
jgi:hypothetical protein